MPLRSQAQSASLNQTVQWSKTLSPVGLGSGVNLTPGQIAVLNAGVNPQKYIWQNKHEELRVLDYAQVADTINKLHINAWGEYDSWFASANFSFDYNNYQAYTGNTRNWEVDVVHSWTAKILAPHLTPVAISYQSDPIAFQDLYGNYAVTGIDYVRKIRILFSQTFNKTVTSSQWSAAIQGSYGYFSGGISASQEQSRLESIGQVTITVEVDGDNGSTLLATGASGDLAALQNAVAQQLAQWDNKPADPNDAGTVDLVYLTSYKAVTPHTNTGLHSGPSQILLTNCLTKLIQLLSAQQRLQYIYSNETNLNRKLFAYLYS